MRFTLKCSCNGLLPNCPTLPAPPAMTIGSPAYLPRPPSSQGGVKARPPRGGCLESYRANVPVANTRGIAEASSRDMFGGTYQCLAQLLMLRQSVYEKHLRHEVSTYDGVLLKRRHLRLFQRARMHPVSPLEYVLSTAVNTTYTLSPATMFVTPSPTFATTPAASKPKIAGHCLTKEPRSCINQSSELSPMPRSSIRTSPGAGLGMSMSSRESTLPTS